MLDKVRNVKMYRYRKPSMRTVFGVTKVKRKVRKITGLCALNRYSAPRVKQRVETKAALLVDEALSALA